MNEERARRLQQAGIDVEELLGRFMGNENLMMRFLSKFPQDENYAKLEQALEQGNETEAYTAAHTLKGVTGNLSLKQLYQLVCNVVEPLRQGDLEMAKKEMPALRDLYTGTVRAIQEEMLRQD